MSEVTKCAACRTERRVSEMQTCMHAQMHYYVCDSKCMHDFYNPPKKPSYSELAVAHDAMRAENERLRGELATVKKVAYGNLELLNANEAMRAELAALSAPAAGQKPVVFAVHSPEVGADPDSSLVDEEDAALYAPECVTPLYAAPTTAGQDVSALVEALEKIVAIELKDFGADWEEIEEAQEIASDALAANKAGGEA